MGLFDFVKKKGSTFQHDMDTVDTFQYDMDTLDGINAIPVPAKNYNTGDPTKDCIYYVLQRKATEHKKNGNMELAIACLRKSNALSDYADRPLLMQKDYMRLVKYLEKAGDEDAAAEALTEIYQRHPEFLDKRISNKPRIAETLSKCREWKVDLVHIQTNSTCPICSKINNKIFSISGRSKKYPKLPAEIVNDGGLCKDCFVDISAEF